MDQFDEGDQEMIEEVDDWGAELDDDEIIDNDFGELKR